MVKKQAFDLIRSFCHHTALVDQLLPRQKSGEARRLPPVLSGNKNPQLKSKPHYLIITKYSNHGYTY